MAWPDMSFAPEGDLIRCRWRSRRLPFSTGLTYITSGDEWVKRRDFEAALSDLVWSVVARLVDEGIAGTYLQLPWHALSIVLDDQRYTVAMLDRPENPKEARFSERDYGRFGSYFEYEIDAKKALELNYRVWVQGGEMTVPQVTRLGEAFVHPVEVKVK